MIWIITIITGVAVVTYISHKYPGVQNFLLIHKFEKSLPCHCISIVHLEAFEQGGFIGRPIKDSYGKWHVTVGCNIHHKTADVEVSKRDVYYIIRYLY